MKKVVFISGEICSGKDTAIEQRYFSDEFVHIDLGQLVREKFQTQDRVFNNNLESYFVESILGIIALNEGKIFVITGLRQPSLAVKLANLFDVVKHIYLVVPRKELKRRYETRASVKDKKITFEDAIAGDQSLGMKDLQYYLLTEVQCDFINNYEEWISM